MIRVWETEGLYFWLHALNCFLRDVYGKRQILKDGVIPGEFVFSAKGFLLPCDGVMPPKGIFSHISGIDLVQSKDDNWYILEDNLRVPSGASYPMIAREFQRKSAPAAFLRKSLMHYDDSVLFTLDSLIFEDDVP